MSKTYADFGIDVPDHKHGEIDAICPKCTPARRKQNKRDLSVNTDLGAWLCHHCGWAGTLDGGEQAGGKARPSRPAKSYQKPKPLTGAMTDEGLAWFASRGIPAAVVARNNITQEQAWSHEANGMAAAFAYPYVRDGEHVNTKYRFRGKSFAMEAGCERVFYGLDDCAGAETIVIVEGEMDKLACEAAGIVRCLSVPDGAPAPDAKSYESKFAFMADPAAEAIFENAREVIIATDADAPGQKLADELSRRIGLEKCLLVTWPEGVKDANEALVAHGPDGLADIIGAAEPWPIEGLVSVKQAERGVWELYRGNLAPGESTGFPSLDAGYTVKPGQLTIATGYPGSGKSEFLDAVFVNLAIQRDWRFAIYSPENHPAERHVVKLLEKALGKPFGAWATGTRMTEDEVERGVTWLNEHFTFMAPESPTLDNVLELARVEARRRGIKGLIIDPWNELEPARDKGMSETEYISHALTKCRQFARHHRVHVWIVAHPAKPQKLEDGSYPVPRPYDISGSAHWFNKADNALAVARDKTNDEAPVQIHIQKIRFKEVGSIGVAELAYERATGRYRDLDTWYPGSQTSN